MSNQKDIFTYVVDHFSSEQEDMRAAAAFAAGKNIIMVFLVAFHLPSRKVTLRLETYINSCPPSSKWSKAIPRNVCLLCTPPRK